MSISLIICIAAAAIYLVEAVIFFVLIQKRKKQIKLNGGYVPTSGSKFKSVLIVSIVLLVLPVFIPLETYLVAVVGACADLAVFIAMRERLSLLKVDPEE